MSFAGGFFRFIFVSFFFFVIFSLASTPSPGAAEEVEEQDEDQPGSTPLSATATTSPAGTKLELARQYNKSKRYDEALKLLKEALALAPEPALAAEILFETGSTCFARGQAALEERISGLDGAASIRQGAEVFAEVLRTHPKSEQAPKAAYMTGSSYLLLDELQNALAAYERAYRDFPQSKQRSRALLRVGVCQAGLGETAKAMETFGRLRRDFPKDSADLKKAVQYLDELALVGKQAPVLRTSEWLLGLVGPDGIETFRGQVVVLVFFATWCQHCKGNLPRLRSLIRDWAGEGVVFLGVANPNDPRNTERVEVYVQRNRLEYLDIALDRSSASWGPYHVAGLPATVLIDRQGIIRWRGNLAFFPLPLLKRLAGEQ